MNVSSFPQFGTDLHRRVYSERWEIMTTFDDGLERIKTDDNFALVWASEVMSVVIGDDCTVIPVEENVLSGIMAMAMRQGYPYKRIIDHL